MNPTQLHQAVQNTPLIQPDGEPEYMIVDRADRARLLLAITRDADVMADLFGDVIDKMTEDGLADNTTNAMLAIENEQGATLAGLGAVFGSMFYGHLYSVIQDHITKHQERWLQDLRDAERDGQGDLDAFKAQRGVA